MAHSFDSRAAASTRSAMVWTWLFFLALAFWPRFFILGFWIFGRQIGDAFSGWVVPALGFLVAPSTTLAYAIMWSLSSDRVAGGEWLVVGLAAVVDVVTWALWRRIRSG